jgi:hypothetical protein
VLIVEDEDETASWRDWLWALARLRPLWPLPALLFLALVLPFAPDEVWRSTMSRRRQWSLGELTLVMSGLGTLLYWLTLFLSQAGLLNVGSRTRWMMREPSEAELAILDACLRFMCLLMAYSGPLLLLFAPR